MNILKLLTDIHAIAPSLDLNQILHFSSTRVSYGTYDPSSVSDADILDGGEKLLDDLRNGVVDEEDLHLEFSNHSPYSGDMI